ncbi:hypothetical protein EUX98_g2204 [Antrodiella citrinella]|uniref:branched-chain-amino-acid transaminase n=1 Tax=Antrodiella citrinella TaxID=2447956 RepID=A0A4S4MZK9_9APHY|nr:hypothetical protein EUX98_g2204 [Antrodiella citrinella]
MSSLKSLRLLSSPLSRSGRPSLAHSRWVSSVSQNPVTGDIEPSKLKTITTDQPKELPSSSGLVFGRTFTDHMLTIPWKATTGWGPPTIQPYGPLSLPPSATVFHYAQEIFEGLKAYRDATGRVTMFRPDMNMKRMNTSAQRVALPTFNGAALIELLKSLIRKDKHWIPDVPGYSLYIRPTLIGTQPALGVQPPDEALLFVICSPVGPYYPTGFKPIALYGTTEFSRAAPGGIGAFKLGANYAPGVVAQREAAAKGYAQNLWLHGPDHHITEVGTMNTMVVFKQPNGVTELVTPPLDGMILPGVTRDSVLALARDHISGQSAPIDGLTEKLVVSERPVTMKEVKEASQDGRLVEFFGTGTAAVISTVDKIGYLGEDVHIPVGSQTVFGNPPKIPREAERYRSEHPQVPIPALNKHILSSLSLREGKATALRTLVEQYTERHGRVLDASLVYESRPSEGRKTRFESGFNLEEDDGVVMIAHALQHGAKHKVTVCSGFVLNVPDKSSGSRSKQKILVSCAHTLEEIRNSRLARDVLSNPFISSESQDQVKSGSFVITGPPSSPTFHPISAIASSLHRSDLLVLSTSSTTLSENNDVRIRSLPVSPYPAHPGTPIRAHFVVDTKPDDSEEGWTPWVGGTWRKWVKGMVVGYKDFAGRDAQPGTYDALSHLFFQPLPTPGSSGGPIVDEESGAVVGVMLGTRMDNRISGVRGWGVPSEAIFEMFSLPGLELKRKK